MALPLDVGTMGPVAADRRRLLDRVKRLESAGFASIWWPDHLMAGHPQSMWTPDVAEITAHQATPHSMIHPVAAIAAAATATDTVHLGVAVTESLRYHPATIAHMYLSLDHLTEGRAILGLGAGEGKVEAYGVKFARALPRLREAIDVIRLLWAQEDPVRYDGELFQLKDAVLGMQPYRAGGPPIWLAAHGAKSLELAGRQADGWLPLLSPVEEYARRLERLRQAARDHGREPDTITPGMLAWVVIGEDTAACRRILDAPLVKLVCLMLSSEDYERWGYEHPLGRGKGAFADLVPSRIGREQATELLDRIPRKVVEEFLLCGTPEHIAERLEDYSKAGLRHVVLWNVTHLGDYELGRPSFDHMARLASLLKE